VSSRVESRIAADPWGWFVLIGAAVVAAATLLTSPTIAAVTVFAIPSLALLLWAPRYAVLAVLLFLLLQDPLQILAGGDGDAALYVKRADEVMLLALGTYCIIRSQRVRAILTGGRLGVGLACCYGSLLISTIIERPFPIAAIVDLVLFSKPFLLLGVGIWLSPYAEKIEGILAPLFMILLLVLGSAIPFMIKPSLLDAYLGDIGTSEIRLGFRVAQGLFLHPATLAWVAVATFCIGYAAYLVYHNSTYLMCAVFSAVLVTLSWRRKSLAGLALVVALSMCVSVSSRTRMRATTLAVILCCVSVVLLGPHLLTMGQLTLEEYGLADPYDTARSALYYTSFLIARDHFPLGSGLASFGGFASVLYYSNTYYDYGLSFLNGVSKNSPAYVTDTFWPMVLGEGGIICLAGYILILQVLISRAWRLRKTVDEEPHVRMLALVTLFLLGASLSESTASHIYGGSLQAALVFIPAGMLLGIRDRGGQRQVVDADCAELWGDQGEATNRDTRLMRRIVR